MVFFALMGILSLLAVWAFVVAMMVAVDVAGERNEKRDIG